MISREFLNVDPGGLSQDPLTQTLGAGRIREKQALVFLKEIHGLMCCVIQVNHWGEHDIRRLPARADTTLMAHTHTRLNSRAPNSVCSKKQFI